MGNMQALSYAEGVEEGSVALETALTAHFRSTHFPPLPYELVPIAADIVRGEIDIDGDVELPEGISYRGSSTAPVWSCVEAWHLGAFLEREDDK
jgi:hypothetical protein